MDLIKRSSDYALRSLVYMASFPQGKRFDVASISKARSISPVFLYKIFQKLSKARILISHRGVGGGFSISKDLSAISVREIVELLQGPIIFNRCLARKDICGMSGACSMRKNLDVLQHRFMAAFDRLTIEDLADEEREFKK